MTHNTIGYNIRKLRKQNGMTQEQLAQRLNLKRQTLSNYEIGKRVPDIYELIELSDIFAISLDELVGRNKQSKRSSPP